MDEEEILKARVLGYAPIERIRSFIDHITVGQTDEVTRIKLVSEEVFSIFSSQVGVAEALFDIDVDYSVGYLNKLGVACPSALQAAVDNFIGFSLGRLDADSSWKVFSPMVMSRGALATSVYNSRVAYQWISSNRAFMQEWTAGQNQKVLHKEKLKFLEDKWSRIGSSFS